MLTDRERQLLELCVEVYSVKDVARKMGVTDSTAYNMLHRIRRKYVQSRLFVNTILGYRRKSPLLNKVLSPRTSTIKESETQAEEEERGET